MFFALTMWGFGLTCLHAVIQLALIQFWKMESYFWKSYVYPLLYFRGKLINNYYYIAGCRLLWLWTCGYVPTTSWFYCPYNQTITQSDQKKRKALRNFNKKVYAFDLPSSKKYCCTGLQQQSDQQQSSSSWIGQYISSLLQFTFEKMPFHVGELIALPMSFRC